MTGKEGVGGHQLDNQTLSLIIILSLIFILCIILNCESIPFDNKRIGSHISSNHISKCDNRNILKKEKEEGERKLIFFIKFKSKYIYRNKVGSKNVRTSSLLLNVSLNRGRLFLWGLQKYNNFGLN